MSERGTFALDRGWFDHPVFKDEPFTEREAWAWLIAQAAYRPHRRRIGAADISLARGQMAASLRFMAEKWKWTEPRVRRFLTRLKTDAMIDAATDAGITTLTVRNYERYQRPTSKTDAPRDAANDAAATQQRRKGEEKEERKKEGGGGEGASGSMISDEAFAIAGEVMAALSIDRTFVPPGWCGAPMRIQAGLNEGWQREIILIAAQKVAANKRDGAPDSFSYLEKPIAREHALASKPLPKVVINNRPETIHAQTDQHHPGGAYGASKDRFREAHAALKDFIAQQDGGDSGRPIVELLPAARRG